MPAPIACREFAKDVIDRAIRKALDTLGRKPRRAFDHLLWNVQARSELLRPSRHAGRFDAGLLDRIVQGLLALIEHRRGWLRPIDEWQPDGRTSISIFSSLAHHLLARYPVPPVLLSAWFGGIDRSARRRQDWFRHVGRGGSLRTAGFPVELNRRMAHEFAHAPADFPIEFALRWAQVRGLGGTDALARAVAESRLGREQSDDGFWVSIFQFLVNRPEIGPVHVDPVVEFLHHRRSERRRVIIVEDTEVEIDGPEPDLSVKGWSAASLLRRVEEWRERRQAEEREARRIEEREARRKARLEPVFVRWERSGIGEFRTLDVGGQTWTVRELLDSDELASEGRAMSHCVATYTARCALRTSTIWSVGIQGTGDRERVVTVEVNPTSREVVQVKARHNGTPDEVSLAILRQWAGRESLKIEV